MTLAARALLADVVLDALDERIGQVDGELRLILRGARGGRRVPLLAFAE